MSTSESAVVELRRYTLHPGTRDALIELFDRELVESQEAVGIDLIGQFRDVDDPDRFVWLRGYPDLESRRPALAAFYGGRVWKRYAEAANATMVDSDDVFLLRPARPGSGFSLDAGSRPRPGSNGERGGLVVAAIYSFDAPVEDALVDLFADEVTPAAEEAGASVLACLVTESSPNTFPALPAREGENVLVWFAGFAEERGHERYLARDVPDPLARHANRPPETLALAPTPRSLLRGTSS